MAKISNGIWHRATQAACGVSLLFAGCLNVPVPYIYPTIENTPNLTLTAPVAEVVAFRMDAFEYRKGIGVNGDSEVTQIRLRMLPLSPDGIVPAQTTASIAYGCIRNESILAVPDCHTQHTVSVRLYRAGYHTIQVQPSSQTKELVWEKCNCYDQEKAIDDLTWPTLQCGGHQPENHGKWNCFPELAPGSTCAEHRKALLFLANEYEKLNPKGESSDLAVQKARNLRESAAQ